MLPSACRTLLVAPCLALALAFLAGPGPALAQGVPITDVQGQMHWGLALGQRIVHGYFVAREWRDASMAKARSMINQTRRVVRLRTKYEGMAVGQLGRLGDRVPDWRQHANYCAVDLHGMDVCEVENFLAQGFERVLDGQFEFFRNKLFETIGEVEREVERILGRHFSRGIDLAAEILGDAPEGPYIRTVGLIQVAADNRAILEDAAMVLNTVLDSLTLKEIEDRQISSGRARQISTHLAYVEATVAFEATRARLELLDARILGAADAVREQRRHTQTQRVTH